MCKVNCIINHFQGNTELQGDIDAIDRKIKFSGVRSSYKYYDVSLEQNAKEGSATVIILKKTSDKRFETVVKVPIVLEVPPPPRPKTAGPLKGGNIASSYYDTHT